MKTGIKPPYKNKRLTISLDVKNPLDIKGALLHIVNEIYNGQPIGTGKYETGSYFYELEFTELSDFTEKEIAGVWYRIYASQITKENF